MKKLTIIAENGTNFDYNMNRYTKDKYIKPLSLYEYSNLPYQKKMEYLKIVKTYNYILEGYLNYRNINILSLRLNTRILLHQIADKINEEYIYIKNIECDKTNYDISVILDFIIFILKRYDTHISIYTYNEFVVNRIGRYIIEEIISCDNINVMLLHNNEIIKTKYDNEGDIINYPLGFFSGIDM